MHYIHTCNTFLNLYWGKDSLSLQGLIIFAEKSQSLPAKIMSLDCILLVDVQSSSELYYEGL